MLGTKEFSDLIYDKLVELKDEIVLTNPSTTSKFPCRELSTPLKSINKTDALATFQISIKHWHEKERSAMEMTDKTDDKLLEYNLVRINTSICMYDSILQKYGITTTYEVRYNALTNAFQRIR
jgi:hypothetical protein